ncbi:DUF397 domain-containing protein [Streptomyces regalis]|uniref:Toxin n=1 Tax=Streptomyces regalis TaxID=68262 RepID=A0A124G7A1_9ACTN|nr:DUF397 domain-containing protein [Streptomyces regalis]KUL22077.1 toxin [Streptomyces regalis]
MTGTLRWFKTSYSSDSGGECLEVAYAWRKSSYSSSSGGECVEVALCPHTATTIHIRDSKNPDGPNLTVSTDAWALFIGDAAH